MSKSSFELAVLPISTQRLWKSKAVCQDFTNSVFILWRGDSYILFAVFSQMVYPKGIFLGDAFVFLLFATFEYSRFPDEKTLVPVSSDLYIEAYLCFIDTGHFSWDAHRLPAGTGFQMNNNYLGKPWWGPLQSLQNKLFKCVVVTLHPRSNLSCAVREYKEMPELDTWSLCYKQCSFLSLVLRLGTSLVQFKRAKACLPGVVC